MSSVGALTISSLEQYPSLGLASRVWYAKALDDQDIWQNLLWKVGAYVPT